MNFPKDNNKRKGETATAKKEIDLFFLVFIRLEGEWPPTVFDLRPSPV